MEELGKVHQLIIPLFGHNMVFNLDAIVYTWIVMLLILLFGILSARKRGMVPGAFQVLGELFVSKLYDLTEDALGREMAKTYAPLVCALFMFLVLCNWIGIIPHLEEPTKDLNTPLSLGSWVFSSPIMSASRPKASKPISANISNRFLS